jgi:dynein heavy chain
VTGYLPAEDKFTVRFSSGQQAKMYRIHLHFPAENPVTFAARVGKAHETRRTYEASMRYSLYVDSMPTDEIQPLDTEQVNRILLLAVNTKKLKQNALDTTSLLNEVNIDFARTMNKVVFDASLQLPNSAALSQLEHLPSQTQAQPEAPYLAVVSVPFHDFPKHFSDFCFHSFYTKPEAISALVNINMECLKLETMNLFNTSINKGMRLEEFDQLQITTAAQLQSHLETKWTAALAHCIKSSLKEVGKGWFNLGERNREVYTFSKLKKFMMMINFYMQDSLRFMIMDSLAKYRALFEEHATFTVVTRATNDALVLKAGEPVPATHTVVHKVGDDEEHEGPHYAEPNYTPAVTPLPHNKFALFTVDLVVREGKITYTTNPNDYSKIVLGNFDKSLSLLHNIGQLEILVMEQLFWFGNESKVMSVQKHEPLGDGPFRVYRTHSAGGLPSNDSLQETL